MSQVVLIGGGGHAKVVAAILHRLAGMELLGYTDETDRGPLLTVPYLGNDEVLPTLIERQPATGAAIGLGRLSDPAPRRALVAKVQDLGFHLPAIVAPTALVANDVEIGAGAQVLDRVIINPGARIGACAIVNTAAIVEHDTTVGELSHVAPGAILCGGVRLGADVFIGAGAVVVQGVTVASGTVLGAGSVLTRDAREGGVYLGVPARRMG